MYNFSRDALQQNVDRMVTFYNSQVDDFARYVADGKITDPAEHVKGFIDTDTARISSYRPFTREHVWFDAELNDMVYRLPSMFPTPDQPNYGVVIMAPRPGTGFAVTATDLMPELSFYTYTGQFFPRFTYQLVEQSAHDSGLDYGDHVVDGYRRIDNVTDQTLAQYRAWYGVEVTKAEIFAFIYGLLHSPDYRDRFAHDLARTLPRIPRIDSDDWPAFRDAGQALMDLHIGYETVDPYPLSITGDQPMGIGSTDLFGWFAVDKMRWGGNARAADKSTIIYNPRVTVAGIPDEVHEYMLGSRSAIEWIIDRYRITTDKASGIANNPNDYSRETGNPRYILDLLAKVVTVSVETVKIVDSLPTLNIFSAA